MPDTAKFKSFRLDELFELTKDHKHEPDQDECPTCGPYEVEI